MISIPTHESILWNLLKRLMFQFFTIIVLVSGFFFYSYTFFWDLFLTLVKKQCSELKIISTSLTQPFSLTVSMILFLSLAVMIPLFIYQLWVYLRPAFYHHERRFIVFQGAIWAVFFLGLQLFGLFFLVPCALNIFISFNDSIVESYVELGSLIGLFIGIQQSLMVLSCCPLVMHWVLEYKLISTDLLIDNRGQVYISFFVFAMLITPPDVLLQCLVALPLIACFEFLVSVHHPKKSCDKILKLVN